MSLISDYQAFAEEKINSLNIIKAPNGLYEPIQYIISLGGKRIRPALCLAACHYFSGNSEISINAALGLEVFHNFTLLHDDLMDKSPIRRNQLTVHNKWSDNSAILSGDAMMIKASQLMLDVPVINLKEINELYLKTALEVCEGQQYDMDFEKRNDVEIDDYLEMIRLKTAVLLATSFKTGAILGGASKTDADLMYAFGQSIGMAFQLQDDYLDVFGDSKSFGKKVGQDIVSNKKTFLLISCLKKAEGNQLRELRSWVEKENFDPDEKVKAVKQIYKDLEIDKLSREKMNCYYSESMSTLDKIKIDKVFKDDLKEFAGKLMIRSN